MTMLDHALSYAAKGLPVFPLQPGGKKPLPGSNGFKDATTDVDKIKELWAAHPDANIGMPTGIQSGLWVLDIDGPVGSASLTELEGELGVLPETRDQATGGGGTHYFFEWTGREVRNKQALRPGVDVRGEGGYVVVAPSVHASGRTYSWQGGENGRIYPAPKAWLDFVCPDKRVVVPWERVAPRRSAPPRPNLRAPVLRRATLYLDECEAAIQGSGGHNALLWAARALVVGFDMSDAAALSLLWSEFNPRCRPQWDESKKADRRDFERKVGEARRTPGSKPVGWLLEKYGLNDDVNALRQIARGKESATLMLARAVEKAKTSPAKILLEDPDSPINIVERREFPIDQFPGPVRDFIVAVSESHNVDLSFAALPALCVAAAAMGNAFRLRLKRGFEVPPTIWVGLVSPSGTNKSGPLKAVVDPLRATIRLEDISDAMVNPQGRTIVSDATLEAVVSRLGENPRGLLMFRDELAGWLKSFNAYKGGGGGDEQAWLEFWNASEYIVDRKTNDEQICIPAASCCVLGGVQPRLMLECFDPKRFASGLVARILITCPPARDMFWSDEEISASAESDWAQVITWLRTRPFAGLDTNRGQFQPRILTPTIEAKVCYEAYFNQLFFELGEVGDENCKALISKATVTAARLALIHHGLVSACGGEKVGDEVGLASIKAGAAWSRWCLEEQIRVHGFGDHERNRLRSSYLVEAIKARCGGSANVSRVQKLNNRRYKNNAAAKAAIDQIVEMGFAHWQDTTEKVVVII